MQYLALLMFPVFSVAAVTVFLEGCDKTINLKLLPAFNMPE